MQMDEVPLVREFSADLIKDNKVFEEAMTELYYLMIITFTSHVCL
jgi:exonuclease SbcD